MIEISIPGFGKLSLKHLVLDYNGTLATDGILIAGVQERLFQLNKLITIHILTADTFGLAASELTNIPCKITIIEGTNEDQQKEEYVNSLGLENVVAFGNGNNDRKMLTAARLGISIIGSEGCSPAAIQAADMIVANILDGLDLLLKPLRCKATLRF